MVECSAILTFHHGETNVFISNAYAQAAPAAGGAAGFIQTYGFFILMIVVLYFFMIRPQMKRQKEHRNMLAAMTKGDEVLTSGGIVGKVTKVGEAYVGVELSDGVEVTVQKSAVSAILPKGTIKSL
ncbi:MULTISPECIES: preprotein translocase subunit YajC [Burkholderiaceae]|uniref:preprotein translocase subunit YajC n=1 Tax=Burkholderiaceae TaxID=119060 RepID=UPI00095ECC6C|nr:MULTISPECIES: preprotein translocase subunit YajC [Burkholderiaceae]MCF2132894.1 preprotein translocase subunit YajC [Mycetohabitans sp. B3]MCG1017534.1 preprotein translocase subunit YajC [Mycetohabitans sp. B4]MCG1038343.1 preprotein translocase subunit YajC [Mycetohabitans sp. B7]SIT68995.1 protein translocase subunit yajC [Burkholderia sp. b13]SIT78973.1 preprotein translocase subunit YajC [Burkholderia sp. b14]